MIHKIKMLLVIICLSHAPLLFSMQPRNERELQEKINELKLKKQDALDAFNGYDYAITQARKMEKNSQLATELYRRWSQQHPGISYDDYYDALQASKEAALDHMEQIKNEIKEINNQLQKLERIPPFKDRRRSSAE